MLHCQGKGFLLIKNIYWGKEGGGSLETDGAKGQTSDSVLCRFSHVRLFETPQTVAQHASLSMGFSRQEYWSGLPFSSPGDFPNPGMESVSLLSPELAGRFFTTSATSVTFDRLQSEPGKLL